MKKHFLTGLVLLLPFVVSIMLAIWVVGILTMPFMHITENFLEYMGWGGGPILTMFVSRSLAILSLLLFTTVFGFLGTRFLIAAILQKVHALFARIPGFRMVFNFSKEIIGKVFDEEAPTFDGTALVAFPYEDSYSLGLVSHHVPKAAKKVHDKLEMSIFVPTAPHPISGFVLMTEKQDVHPLNLQTDEVFKFQLSCGVLSNTQGKT